jgi:hypothetical protein
MSRSGTTSRPEVGAAPLVAACVGFVLARGRSVVNFERGGIVYTVGAGRFEDGGLAEIFLSTAKHGTAVDTNDRDAAVVAASLLLQHGCPVETLRRALTRNSDGSASGPLARALDLLEIGRQAAGGRS